jgi:hypothetical protein
MLVWLLKAMTQSFGMRLLSITSPCSKEGRSVLTAISVPYAPLGYTSDEATIIPRWAWQRMDISTQNQMVSFNQEPEILAKG